MLTRQKTEHQFAGWDGYGEPYTAPVRIGEPIPIKPDDEFEDSDILEFSGKYVHRPGPWNDYCWECAGITAPTLSELVRLLT